MGQLILSPRQLQVFFFRFISPVKLISGNSLQDTAQCFLNEAHYRSPLACRHSVSSFQSWNPSPVGPGSEAHKKNKKKWHAYHRPQCHFETINATAFLAFPCTVLPGTSKSVVSNPRSSSKSKFAGQSNETTPPSLVVTHTL